MPKCFIYSVRGYRDGRFWDTEGDHTNVMRTRSGRTISTMPCFPPGVNATKPPAAVVPPKAQQDFYKQFNRKVIRYRDIAYLSMVTRCKLMAKQVPVHLLGSPNDTTQWIEDSPFLYDQTRWSFDLQGRPKGLDNISVDGRHPLTEESNDCSGLKNNICKRKDNKDDCAQMFLDDVQNTSEQRDCLTDSSVSVTAIGSTDSTQNISGYGSENIAMSNNASTNVLRRSSDSLDLGIAEALQLSEATDDSPFYLCKDNGSCEEDVLYQNPEISKNVVDSSEETITSPVMASKNQGKDGNEEKPSKKVKAHPRAKDFKLRVCLRPKKSKTAKNQVATEDDKICESLEKSTEPIASSSSCSLSDKLESISTARVILPTVTPVTSLRPSQIPLLGPSAIRTIGPVLFPSITKTTSLLHPGIFNIVSYQGQPFRIIAKPPEPTVIPVVLKGHSGFHSKPDAPPRPTENSHNSQVPETSPVPQKHSQPQLESSIKASQVKFKNVNEMNEAIKKLYVNNVLNNAIKADGAAEKTSESQGPQLANNNDSDWSQGQPVPSSPCGSQTSQSSMDSAQSHDSIALDSDDSSLDSNEIIEKFSHEVHAILTDSQGNELHRCLVCSRVFTVLTAFKSHVRTHIRQANKCSICGKVFSRSWLLKGHMRVHTGEKPFKCSHPGCDKAFADKSNLRSHRQTHDIDNKPYICSVCHRGFAQKRYLHKHQHEVCIP